MPARVISGMVWAMPSSEAVPTRAAVLLVVPARDWGVNADVVDEASRPARARYAKDFMFVFLRFSFDTCTVCDGSSAAPTSQLKNTKSAVKQGEEKMRKNAGNSQQHVTAALRTYTVRRDFAQNVDQGQKLAREKKSTVANHF